MKKDILFKYFKYLFYIFIMSYDKYNFSFLAILLSFYINPH